MSEVNRFLEEKDVKVGEAIANGGFSVVFRGKTTDGQVVAVKKMALYNPMCSSCCCPCFSQSGMKSNIISTPTRRLNTGKTKRKLKIQTSKMTTKEALDEARMLEQLRSEPFFLKYLGSYFTNNGKTCCVITELCVCNLRTMMKSEKKEHEHYGKFPISVAFHFIIPILEALCHMHEQGIIHRDIKEENVLITYDGIPKICDLGLAITFKRRHNKPVSISAEAMIGTNWYMPPEIVRKEKFNEGVDTWSTAMMFLSLIRGGNPFNKYDSDGVTLWNEHVVNFYQNNYEAFEKEIEGTGQREFYKLAGIDLYETKEDNDGKNTKLWRLIKKTLRKMVIINYKKRPMPSDLFQDEDLKFLEIYMGLWHEYLETREIQEDLDRSKDKHKKFRKQFNKVVNHVDRLLEARLGG